MKYRIKIYKIVDEIWEIEAESEQDAHDSMFQFYNRKPCSGVKISETEPDYVIKTSFYLVQE